MDIFKFITHLSISHSVFFIFGIFTTPNLLKCKGVRAISSTICGDNQPHFREAARTIRPVVHLYSIPRKILTCWLLLEFSLCTHLHTTVLLSHQNSLDFYSYAHERSFPSRAHPPHISISTFIYCE